ncbi:unnamed protein product, partial [Sphenostylis stenocarpa]
MQQHLLNLRDEFCHRTSHVELGFGAPGNVASPVSILLSRLGFRLDMLRALKPKMMQKGELAVLKYTHSAIKGFLAVKPSDASQSFIHFHHKLRLHHTHIEYSLTMHPHFSLGPTLPFPQPLPPYSTCSPPISDAHHMSTLFPLQIPTRTEPGQAPLSFSQAPFASGYQNKRLSYLHVANPHWTNHWNPRMLSRLYNNLDRFPFTPHTSHTTSHARAEKKTTRMAPNVLFSVLSMLLLLLLHPTIAGHDYRDALRKSILFFEGQRSGKLPADQRLRWRRDSALHDGATAGVDLSGGYYDAGDNIKFGFPMAFTTTMLSWSVIDFEKSMGAELGNALKAVRWGTDYLLKATAKIGSGVVFVQVGDPYSDHNCWERPEDMDTLRTVFKIDGSHPGSDVAGETAAALAAASIVFRSRDPSYSTMLLNRAVA